MTGSLSHRRGVPSEVVHPAGCPPPASAGPDDAVIAGELGRRMVQALRWLLTSLEAARQAPDAPLTGDAELSRQLRTLLLRMLVVLYAEDRKLLPVGGLRALTASLERDHRQDPEAMAGRMRGYRRLATLFRSLHAGAETGDWLLPALGGVLFDPRRCALLDGPTPSRAGPVTDLWEGPLPPIDDLTLYRVTKELTEPPGDGQSWSAIGVEHLGTAYEALLGVGVARLDTPAICLRPHLVWVRVDQLTAADGVAARTRWLEQRAGLTKKQAAQLARFVAEASTQDALVTRLRKHKLVDAIHGEDSSAEARHVLQPTRHRRTTGSHYTPRELTVGIVRRALAPVVQSLGPEPQPEQLLSLAICDPAMGCGAFLIEAARVLGAEVATAWERQRAREGKPPLEQAERPTREGRARQLVSRRCLFGVDRDATAVELAKISLWLETAATDQPFGFLDHALRHGDSLVGLSWSQLARFDWSHAGSAAPELAAPLGELRRALSGPPREQAAAHDALRLVADLVVGAFFAARTNSERGAERHRRLAMVRAWLVAGGPAPTELLELQGELRARLPPFHWMLELPGRCLSGDDGAEPQGMDVFIGNPPFLGGKRISTEHGDELAEWLRTLHGTTKNTDLAAHFFRRAASLLSAHATIGLIATNTIAQGATRRGGLQPLLAEDGLVIYDATRSLPWPGDAVVSVAVVHLATPRLVEQLNLACHLDGEPVGCISSRLRHMRERPNPSHLAANARRCFIGCFLRGSGFVLTTAERDALVAHAATNAERVFPFLGGQEVNTSPTQRHHRYAITLHDLTLSEAAAWPELLEILRQRVKPVRDQLEDHGPDRAHKQRWWQFANTRPELRRAIAPLHRCLVAPRVTKHLCFAFQPTDRIFSDQLCVFAIDDYAHFAVYQSRVHEAWARLHSSTLGDGLRYTPSDCVETFALPPAESLRPDGRLEAMGRQLYEARADLLVEADWGLTDLYNRLRSSSHSPTPLAELRELHEEMDRAVLRAYGWTDLDVVPYGDAVEPARRKALAAFEDVLIERLFALNETRAAAEPG